jgi:hypothetical protein
MLDDLYDDVLSILDEVGFINEMEKRLGLTNSTPLSWGYRYQKQLPSKNIISTNKIIFTYKDFKENFIN